MSAFLLVYLQHHPYEELITRSALGAGCGCSGGSSQPDAAKSFDSGKINLSPVKKLISFFTVITNGLSKLLFLFYVTI